MGQAKQRGTKEQRVEAAIARIAEERRIKLERKREETLKVYQQREDRANNPTTRRSGLRIRGGYQALLMSALAGIALAGVSPKR